jgi:hypothetical protein
MSETWNFTIGDEPAIESLQCDKGIVVWVATYRNSGETMWTYSVNCRIFDPGRGLWRPNFWGWFNAGYQMRQVYSLVVMDGVVAWKTFMILGPEAYDMEEFGVYYTTYYPAAGIWPVGQDLYHVVWGSPVQPDYLTVKDGVAAWPMFPFDDKMIYHARTYDFEIQRWVPGDSGYAPIMRDFQWLEIVYSKTIYRWLRTYHIDLMGIREAELV